MSLIQRVTALAQAVAADIKALYAGKAEKEHTHAADQVIGLGTAATKDVGESSGNVMGVGAFGLGITANVAASIDADDLNRTGFFGNYSSFQVLNVAHALDSGYSAQLRMGTTSSKVFFRRQSAGVWSPEVELIHTGNILSTTGQSTDYPMTQKAVTDAIAAIPSGSTINVVQEKGNSTTDVMSQKSVTDNLDNLGVELDLLRQELNKLKGRLPPEIGDERWGGFYIGDITIPSGDDAGTYMVIMAGEEGEVRRKWKLTDTDTAGTSDYNDGKRNTLAMAEYGISEHPAGEYCVNYRGGGYDDWYLPAINEVALAWDNRALLEDLKIVDDVFWSSTQHSTMRAWSLEFMGGNKAQTTKTGRHWVRPVRRIKIELEP